MTTLFLSAGLVDYDNPPHDSPVDANAFASIEAEFLSTGFYYPNLPVQRRLNRYAVYLLPICRIMHNAKLDATLVHRSCMSSATGMQPPIYTFDASTLQLLADNCVFGASAVLCNALTHIM